MIARRLARVVGLLVAIAATAVIASEPIRQSDSRALVLGLDHIPIAVNDLDAAGETYRALGFALKAGQPHANGLRNQHVKFPDGTEIELITADEGLLTFPEDHPLRYLFLGGRNASPTDQPAHFDHANGAEALVAVWLAAHDFSQELALLEAVGARPVPHRFSLPGRDVDGFTAPAGNHEVRLLPGDLQLVPGRRIVGATVRTRDLDAVRRVAPADRLHTTADPASLFVAPNHSHGLWLEFRLHHR